MELRYITEAVKNITYEQRCLVFAFINGLQAQEKIDGGEDKKAPKGA